MPREALIFDLDGTLLDTLDDIADSMNAVLEAHGLPTHQREVYRYFVGEGAVKLVTRALPQELKKEPEIEEFVSRFRRVYSQNWNVKTRPYDGIPEMLEQLKGLGVRKAVLSNKPDRFTRLCVDEFLSRWEFDFILGENEDMPPKPDPRGAIFISDRLGVSPTYILFVGDTSIDMETALRAGMTPIGALWGFRSGDELRQGGAQFLIEHPLDILKFLGPFSNDF